LIFDVLINLKDTFDVLKFLASRCCEIRRSDPLSFVSTCVLQILWRNDGLRQYFSTWVPRIFFERQ
jgi:hypothetical protein